MILHPLEATTVTIYRWTALAAVWCCDWQRAGVAVADELLSADREIATVVDHYVEWQLSEAGVVSSRQVDEFDALLMFGASGSLRQYLTQAFEERRGWDRIFRDLITGRDEAAEAKGTDQFLKARVKDIDRLTNDVSTLTRWSSGS
jgi:hypothetical protein